MRLCPLRAGLSKASTASTYSLGNPKAWLGAAYHAVLEAAGRIGDRAETAYQEAWADAVRKQHERAQSHPLNRRFGRPEQWPGYHMIRAMAMLRAKEIGHSRSTEPSNPSYHGYGPREEYLTGAGGLIVGRPDFVRGDSIIDYKTGEVREGSASDALKPTFTRQLQIYAYLVRERTGVWPIRGVVIPMEGRSVEVALDPDECDRVVSNAVAILDSYNQTISAGGSATRLARPSPEACSWCPYQAICPPFWEAADGTWTESLGSVAVSGTVVALREPTLDGTSISLTLLIVKGTEPSAAIELGPLRFDIHISLGQIQTGSRIRATGLTKRPNGSLNTAMRTIIVVSDDIPKIIIPEPDPSNSDPPLTV